MSACENGRNHRPRASIAALSAGVGTDITGVAVGGLEQASQAFAVTKGQTQSNYCSGRVSKAGETLVRARVRARSGTRQGEGREANKFWQRLCRQQEQEQSASHKLNLSLWFNGTVPYCLKPMLLDMTRSKHYIGNGLWGQGRVTVYACLTYVLNGKSTMQRLCRFLSQRAF